ncbi:MAG: phage tail sheath subtilisin-like domain-containing protein [Alphaproteobacteria bacterium]|jgi:phage tail sheath gpL-like|nr:phage tail sheath subtilisin-like domain-containing protein [Alphaproteobacteria bacterium]
MITFSQIASNEKIPGYYGEFTTVNANQGVFDYPTRILVIGQLLSSGSADALTKHIIADPKQAQALFGRGSQLALMCEIILGIQDSIEVHAIGQEDDGASATADGSLLVTSAATSSGTLYLYIAGTRLKVGISADDTEAEIATAITAAINDKVDLPVTAEVNGDTDEQVDITAKNAGLCGNEIKIAVNNNPDEVYPAGFAMTITQLSGGTTNPDIADVIDAIEGDWFTDIVMPYTDAANLLAVEEELEERFSATGKMDATLSIGYRGTFSEIYTFTDGRNSGFLTNIPVPADSLEPAWLWAAAVVAWEGFWSNQHPARPYKGLVLKGITKPKTEFTTTERRILLGNGCSTWTTNADGNVVLERLVTMYQENAAGIEDETFLDLTTVKTFSHIRYDHDAYISTLYFGEEGKVLTENEQAAAASDILVTPKTISASSKARAELWITEGWVSELINIKAEVDSGDPTRVNMLMSMDITNPLMILAAKLDMRV